MGVARQFVALLWKNFIARKRHPVLFLLEISIPILVFLAVGLVRRVDPPHERSGCSYKERALPSAGMVAFLQSSVCALDNPCVNESAAPDVAAQQQRLRSLVTQLGPSLEKSSTLDALRALPTVSKVFTALRDATDRFDVSKLDDKLKLRNLVKDPDAVVQILVGKYGVLSTKDANNLLDSSLNVMKIMELSTIDWKGITCDPDLLQNYVFFENGVDVTAVSSGLCSINNDLISSLTNELVKQLDISNIIKLAGDLTTMSGDVDMGLLLDDLAGLASMFLDSSSLLASIGDMTELQDLPQLISSMTELIPLMQGIAELDLDSIADMYAVMRPLLPMLQISSDVTTLLDEVFAMNFTQIIEDPNAIDWNTMISQFGLGSAMEELQNLTMMITPTSLEVPSDEITLIIESLMTTGVVMNETALNTTLDYMGDMMKEIMGPAMMDMMMMMGTSMMNMVSDMQTLTSGITDQLIYEVQTNPVVSDALSSLYNYGPENTETFLMEMTKLDNIYGMISEEADMKTVCEAAAVNKLSRDLTMSEVDDFIKNVCQSEASDVLGNIYKNTLYSNIQKKMVDSMNEMAAVLEGGPVPSQNMTMKDMYYEVMNMVEDLSVTSVIPSELWDVLLTNTDGPTYTIWNNINEQYAMNTNTYLNIVTLGKTMEQSDMWETMRVYMTITYAVQHVVMSRFNRLNALAGEGQMLEGVSHYFMYLPEVTNQLLQHYIKEQSDINSIEDVVHEDFLTLVCEHTDWNQLNLSASVPRDDIKTFICTTSWADDLVEVFYIFEPLAMIDEVEDIYLSSYNGTIDWSTYAADLQEITSLYQSDFIKILSQSSFNMETIWETVMYVGESLMEMSGSIASESLRPMSAMLVSVDEMLGGVALWNRVKHYCQFWLYLAKTTNNYLQVSQEPDFNITAYITDQSPTLGAIFVDATGTIPDISSVLTIDDMSKIFTALLSTNYDSLCEGSSLSSTILRQSTSLMMLEDQLCSLDLDAVRMELTSSNENYAALMSQFDMIMLPTEQLPPIQVNWTDLILTSDLYMTLSTEAMNGQLNFYLSTLNSGNLNTTLEDIGRIASDLQGTDINILMENLDSLTNAFMSGSIDSSSPLQGYLTMQTYLQYHIVKFLNIQMKYFNESDVVDLKTYMNSAEVNKLLQVVIDAPELIPVLFETLKAAMYDNNKLTSTPWEEVCSASSTQAFDELIVRANTTTMSNEEIQDIVCSVDVDFNKLYDELLISINGLDELVHALEQAENSTVTSRESYTDYQTVSTHFELLLEHLITSPPTIMISGITIEDHVDRVMSTVETQLESFMSALTMDNNIESILQSVSSQGTGSLDMVFSAVPGMDTVWQVTSLYVDSLHNMIKVAQVFMMAPASRTDHYPEMQKVWSLLDWVPEVFLTYTYSNENDPQKVALFLELLSNSTESLCMANPADLMTVPPGSDFDFAEFFNQFCAINFESLMEEVNEISDIQGISDAYAGLNPVMNISTLQSDIDGLVASTTEFLSSAESWFIPRFLNMTVWEHTLEDMLEIYMQETNSTEEAAQASVNSALGQAQEQLVALQSTSPELDAILGIAHTYIQVVHRVLSIGRGTLLEETDVLESYPNVKLVWDLVQYLPDVSQTLLYTMITDGQKITQFVTSITQGIDELCSENPDDLMTVQPGSQFNFTQFFHNFCLIDFDALVNESLNVMDSDLNTMFSVLDVGNGTTDIPAMIADIEKLAANVTDFTMEVQGVNLPGVLSMTTWETAIEPVLQALMNQSNLNQIMESVSSQGTGSLDMVFSSVPGMDTVWQVTSLYVDSLHNMIKVAQVFMMAPASRTDHYPEMQKVWTLLDWVPEVFLTYTYSNENDPQKVALFLELLSNSTETLCMANPTDLMTVPPGSDFDFADFFNEFCAINFESLMEEVNEISDIQGISDAYAGLNPVMNISTLQSDIDGLVASTTEFLSSAESWFIPRFLNMTVWEHTLKGVLEIYMQETNNTEEAAQASVNSALGQAQEQLVALQSTSPELDAILGIAHTYIQVMHRVLSIGRGTLLEETDVLESYPNVKLVWDLVQYLPDVSQTLLYTMITDGQKITKFVTSITQGIDELCSENPDDLMTVQPGSQFNFTQFFHNFCLIDFDALVNENLSVMDNDLNTMFSVLDVGNGTTDIPAMIADIEKLAANVTDFTMEVQGVNLPGVLSMTTWETAIEPVLQALMNQSNLNQFTSSLNPMENMFEDDISRVLAVVNVILEEVVSAMEGSNSILEGVTGNGTDVLSLLESLEKLTSQLDMTSSNLTFDADKFNALLEDPEMLLSLCESNTLASYLSKPGYSDDVARTLEEVMCISPVALADTLQNQITRQQIEQKIEEILNGTSTADWSGLGGNIEKLVELLMSVADLQDPNTANLTEWLDTNTILDFLENTYMNPQLVFNLLQMMDIDLGYDANTIMGVTARFTELLAHRLQGIWEDSSMSDSVKLFKMLSIVSNGDEWLTMLAQVHGQHVITAAGENPAVQLLVCNTLLMQQLNNFVMDSSVTAGPLLCGLNASLWYPTLVQNNYTYTDMQELQNLLEGFLGEPLMPATSWSDIMESVSSASSSITSIDFEALLQDLNMDQLVQQTASNITSAQNMKLLFDMLVGSESLPELKSLLDIVSSFLGMVDRHITEFGGISVADLLPRSDVVTEVLESTLGQENFATFMTAVINPEQYYSAFLSGTLEEIVCDPMKLRETFMFPEGTDQTQLQQDLCSSVSQMEGFNMWFQPDFNTLLSKIMDLASGSPSSSDHTLSELFERVSAQLTSVLGGLNISPNTLMELEAWVQPIQQYLEAPGMFAENMDSALQLCDGLLRSIEESGILGDMLQPVMDSYLNQINAATAMLEIIQDIQSVSCNSMKNASEILKDIRNSDIPSKLQSVTESLAGGMSGPSMTCTDISAIVNTNMAMIETTWNSLVSETDNLLACMIYLMETLASTVSDASQLMSLSGQIIEIVQEDQFQEFLMLLGNNSAMTDMILEFANMFIEQQNFQETLEQILNQNMTDIMSFFEDSFNLGNDQITTFLQQNFGLSLENMTAEMLLDEVCNRDPGTYPLLNTTLLDLQNTLCGQDRAAALETANFLLQFAQISSGLESLNPEDLWSTLSDDIAVLLQDIEGLSDLATYVERLDLIDITNINGSSLETLQRLLLDKGPDRLLESLNNVLDNFAMDETSSMLVQDMKMLADGLFAFRSLRHIFMTNVHIEDLVQDRDALITMLTTKMGLSSEVALAIAEGSISFEVLLEASRQNITAMICEPDQLADLIKNEENPGLNVSAISHEFCSLDSDTVTNMMEDILDQVDIGDLMQEMIMNGVGSILDEAGTNVTDTKKALEDVQEATADLEELLSQVDDYLDNMPTTSQALTNPNTDDVNYIGLSEMICGFPIGNLEDEINFDRLEGREMELSESQRREMEELPGQACKSMYMDIMSQDAGPIIWGYLKPLLRGKILFAPDNAHARSIIAEVNKTFSSLEDVMSISKDAAKGIVSLKDILSNDGTSDLEEIFDSTVVQAMISSLTGNSGDSFEDMLYTLRDMDGTTIDNLVNVVDWAAGYLECVLLDRIHGYATEAELEAEASKLHYSSSLLAGVVFTNLGGSDREKRQATVTVPSHVEYKVRMNIDNVMHTRVLKERMWRPHPEDEFSTELRYFRGFIQLQDIMDKAIISLQTGSASSDDYPAVITQQIPFPCYLYDRFVNAFGAYGLPLFMTISWIVLISVAVNHLVYDREAGQEETLKAMGMIGVLNWWAWFISTLVVMALVALCVTVLIMAFDIFMFSNFGIIYLYILIFLFSSLMLSYCVSAFFTRPAMAILASLIVYILSYLPYIIIMTLESEMNFWQKSLTCLSSTTAFSFAAIFIARYEETGDGLQWDNIDVSPIHKEEFTFLWGCIMMLIDAAIYLVIGYYVRNVKPGKYGLSQPWYFIVCPWFWCPSLKSKSQDGPPHQQDAFVESIAYDTPVVMSVRGLVKEFKAGERAVDNLSLNIHGGCVTTLLGHNGAAKTTTMKMLTGQIEPTSGEIFVFGEPVSQMRESIGICPQHNCLYEYMTVKEHMEFYASMKSNPKALSDKQEIEKLLKDVGLWHCRHTRVMELSGGNQRRLCVALAFVGGSKLIILDEPTSGVDPSGRRAIWNLIIQQKHDIAILLSTHHLDEADMISDQVVIMHNGRLLSQGSPIFLKHSFSSGHRLTVVKDPQTDTDPSKIHERLRSWVPEVTLQHMYGHEIQFVLPAHSIGQFQDMFKDLEENKDSLHILSYGVSDPTLEEVFLNICSAADHGVTKVNPDTVRQSQIEGNTREPSDSFKHTDSDGSQSSFGGVNKRIQPDKGCSLIFSQFGALLTKRFHHFRRDYRMLLSVLLLPVILLLAAAAFYDVKPDSTEAPSLPLTPALYGPNAYAYYKMNTNHALPNSVVDSFLNAPGVGTSCMAGMNLGSQFKCITPDQQFTEESLEQINSTCFCDDNKYVCDKVPAVNYPRHIQTMTTDILQDLQGKDISKYLLKSYHSFLENRYGGWEFSNTADESKPSNLETRIWYNNKGHHALPSFYNAYSNGLLRSKVNGDPSLYGITTYNHPFLFDNEQLNEATLLQSFADIGIAYCIVVAFTFIPAGVLMYIVTENIRNDKKLQVVSGVKSGLYWISSLIWDMLLYSIGVSIAIGIMAIFQHPAFWDRDNLVGMVVLMFMYGWAALCLMYCVSRCFKDVASAFFVMFCSLIVSGIIITLLIMALDYLVSADDSIEKAFKILKGVFLIIPSFAFASGLSDLISNQVRAEIFARFNTDVYIDPFSLEMIGWNLIALGIEGFVFLMITVLVDIRCKKSRRYQFESPFNEEDEDVARETQRIRHTEAADNVVLVHNLHKVFKGSSKDVHAVNGLNFGVKAGECFGLLGVNGAGKTTTFNILTGMLDSTEGEAVIMGSRHRLGAAHLGYCPQDDALDPYLSVVEMLYFHSKLKGIPSNRRQECIESVMEKLQLVPIQHKIVKNCSGGMKRKLCLAIALLGDPDVVLLDEPTTGLDPKAKRLVWDYLLSAKQRGMSIILTSHSMEECDIMCDRIGIMVNGHFKCLGSSQHLKEKYGSGYTIKLSFSGLSTTEFLIQELIESYFPSARVREYHQSVLQMDIPKDSYRLTDLLSILENEKDKYNIVYYTVAQTTLDTVFLNFAREQTDGSENFADSSDTSSDTYSYPNNSKLDAIPNVYIAHGGSGDKHVYDNPISDDDKMAGLKDNKFTRPALYAVTSPEQINPQFMGTKDQDKVGLDSDVLESTYM